MAYTSEIDKLERRHRENPEGRTFAPLADAYRKAGDVPRALEILKSGLQLHPDYLSASIVLGRCHLDLGDLPGAEAAFRRVLELDKENVIAIKALADITERQTRFGESEDWLNYLLSIDGSNEDARMQLTRLSIIREQHDKMTSPALPGETAEKTREVVAMPSEEAAPEEAVREEVIPERVEPITAKTPAIRLDLDETLEILPPPPAMPEPRFIDPIHSATTEAVDVGVDLDAVFAMAEQHEEAPPPVVDVPHTMDDDEQVRSADADLLMPTETGADAGFVVGVEKHEEIVLRPSSTSEYQTPSDADLLGGRTSGGFAPRFEEDLPSSMAPATPQPADSADESRTGDGLWQSHPEDAAATEEPVAEEPVQEEAVPAGLEHFEEFVPPSAAPAYEPPADVADEPEPEEEEPVEEGPAVEEPVLEPAAAVAEEPVIEPAAVVEETISTGSELMVTETMGDVYAAQGHHVEALEVYRQLLRRSPHDDRLKDKVARLERRAPSPRTKRGFAATETGGQSVSAYFGDLLASRLDESGNGAAATASGLEHSAPEDPSPTPIMDEAFGEAEAQSGGEPTRPASEPLSLSAIFGEDSSPVPPVVAGPEAEQAAERKPGSSFDEFFGERPVPPAGAARVRTIRHSDSDQDDLDQFHKWLKGLKR